MKLQTKLAVAACVSVPLLVYGFSTGPVIFRTGAPVDDNGTTCNACHRGNELNSPGGFVRVEAAPYRAGQKQTIRVTVSHPEAQRWGFQLTARMASDPTKRAGEFSLNPSFHVRCPPAPGREKTADNGCGEQVEFVEHGGTPDSTLGGVNGSKTFEVEWTPPAQDTGDVIFYAAGNAANGNGNNQGDRIYTTSLTIRAESLCTFTGQPRIQSLGNSATSRAGVSFNGFLTIYGSGFGPPAVKTEAGAADVRQGKFPGELACVAVEIGGRRAPITYVDAAQINVQIPTIGQTGTVPVRVIFNPGRANENGMDAGTISLQNYAPAFFTFGGTSSIAARHTDFTIAADPSVAAGATRVRPGETVLLYASGLGETEPSTWQAGEVVSGLNRVRAPVAVTIGGTTLTASDVTYAGLVPGSISGLYQLNVRIPDSAAAGDVPVSMTVGGVTSPAGTTIAVVR